MTEGKGGEEYREGLSGRMGSKHKKGKINKRKGKSKG